MCYRSESDTQVEESVAFVVPDHPDIRKDDFPFFPHVSFQVLDIPQSSEPEFTSS